MRSCLGCPDRDLVIRIHCVFFFNDTATTEIYTLSLHDALPISRARSRADDGQARLPQDASEHAGPPDAPGAGNQVAHRGRSEEHTSELQSRQYLVCRLLLEKKKTQTPSQNAARSGHLIVRGAPC